MDNLIFREVEMNAIQSSQGNLFVKTFVLLKAKSKTDDRMLELKFQSYTKVNYSAFQYIGISNNWIKVKDNKAIIHIKDVETRLYKA